ncbi:MAG: flagellar assembly protein FliX [Hyphomicrobiales bacterium]|uniref:flagellar assembly protein FliX n=1 Tax=Rhabdaerophilum calidifontis TaxID=2604328 RepID=UPI001239ACB5|nr:flagellar assembly protein FliX [Rhabdaerophilum calidifontis]MCA1952699.1 flagellar assembly protein FliX [Hyphomicrobiales bacterium]
MRIVDQKSVGSVSGTRNARGAGRAGGARFTLDSGGALQRAESQAPISILGGLEALIAIQSEDTTRERRRRSARRGQGMLDILDELKLALLAGRVPPELQARLGAALRDAIPSGDPRLDGIVDAIELRAEVELAKLKRAGRRETGG